MSAEKPAHSSPADVFSAALPSSPPPATGENDPGPAKWGAILSMALGVFGLVTAEFLPAGLLTPMAHDLGISQGLAGQAVTTTAAVAAVMGLMVPTLTRHIDRRTVLLGFMLLVIASDILVAAATNVTLLFGGRVLLGLALGGFWTMSTATIMRLVPPALMPRAVSIVYSGISAATVLAIPLGSYIGNLSNWRVVFLVAAGLTALAFAAQLATVPRIEPRGSIHLRTLIDVLSRPGLGIGMLAAVLVFTGHYTFFTYIRPFLEGIGGIGINAMSTILLGFGIASFFGTYLTGFLLGRNVRLALVAMPLTMGVLALLLAGLDASLPLGTTLVALWGLAFGGVPVAWTTWATRAVPDQAESANGLIVVAIGMAIASGAGLGGAIYDASGMTSVFVTSGAVELAAVLLILLAGLGRGDGRPAL